MQLFLRKICNCQNFFVPLHRFFDWLALAATIYAYGREEYPTGNNAFGRA